jgi:hypothetical protein
VKTYACHKYQNGCTCPECRVTINAINAHRQAGRYPFDAEGKIKPLRSIQPQQPWDLAA